MKVRVQCDDHPVLAIAKLDDLLIRGGMHADFRYVNAVVALSAQGIRGFPWYTLVEKQPHGKGLFRRNSCVVVR